MEKHGIAEWEQKTKGRTNAAYTTPDSVNGEDTSHDMLPSLLCPFGPAVQLNLDSRHLSDTSGRLTHVKKKIQPQVWYLM